MNTIPLRAALLCVDCETIFQLTRDREGRQHLCPSCGSATNMPLACWLNRDRDKVA